MCSFMLFDSKSPPNVPKQHLSSKPHTFTHLTGQPSCTTPNQSLSLHITFPSPTHFFYPTVKYFPSFVLVLSLTGAVFTWKIHVIYTAMRSVMCLLMSSYLSPLGLCIVVSKNHSCNSTLVLLKPS